MIISCQVYFITSSSANVMCDPLYPSRYGPISLIHPLIHLVNKVLLSTPKVADSYPIFQWQTYVVHAFKEQFLQGSKLSMRPTMEESCLFYRARHLWNFCTRFTQSFMIENIFLCTYFFSKPR
jgi:hypothetical protein